MGFGTYKPCHGCGGTLWKPVSTLCEECQGLLRAGKAVMQEKEAKAEKGCVFRLPGEWPPFYIPSGDNAVSLRLGKALGTLARRTLKALKSSKDPYAKGVVEVPPQGGSSYSNSNSRTTTLWAGPKGAGAALVSLDEAMREALLHSYHAGKGDGQNFLMQIAKGEISIRDLNEAHIEGNHP